MCEMSSPKSSTLPSSGGEKSEDEFEQDAFAHAGGPQKMRVSAGATEKLTFSTTCGPSKPTATLCNATTGACLRRRRWQFGHGNGSVTHVGNRVSRTCVMRKSTKMMSTEEFTTAEIVERPTPSVPPVVLIP